VITFLLLGIHMSLYLSAAPPGLRNYNITNLCLALPCLDAVYVFPNSNRDTAFPIVYPRARHFSRLVLQSPTYIVYEALSVQLRSALSLLASCLALAKSCLSLSSLKTHHCHQVLYTRPEVVPSALEGICSRSKLHIVP
jgi:hypothetical protein